MDSVFSLWFPPEYMTAEGLCTRRDPLETCYDRVRLTQEATQDRSGGASLTIKTVADTVPLRCRSLSSELGPCVSELEAG
jgi:hypothetical protein